MCGIAGISGPLSSKVEDLLQDALEHRGPDSRGSLDDFDNDISLFHQRLAIIDLSEAGVQPMTNRKGHLKIVYNGELYNFREIRNELRQLGHEFSSQTDTEVVLTAFEEWGASCFSKFNGIFALAIWDTQKNQLTLARDQLGVKPLYLGIEDRHIYFASEIKALIKLMPRLSEVDLQAFRQYVSYIYCPGTSTPFKNVKKLSPGTSVEIRNGKIIQENRFYELPCLRRPTNNLDEALVIEKTKAALRAAIESQLVSDAPVGAFLSGGVDSTAVAAIAKESIGSLECFTINSLGGRDQGELDDLPFAKLAAKKIGLNLNIVDVKPDDIPNEIEKMIWHLDEPIADPACLNTLYISQLARKMGIKVMLSGTGGDDIFSGYRRHQALKLNEFISRLPRQARGLFSFLARSTPSMGAYSRRLSKLASILDDFESNGLPTYFLWETKDNVETLFQGTGDRAVDAPMKAFVAKADINTSSLQRMLALEQRFFLADHNLLYADKMGMANGVEIRVPFLDLGLVEHAANVADKFRIRGSNTKWILKKAVSDLVPKEIINRPKTGFGVPIRRWMKHELRDYVFDTLSYDAVKRRGIFNPVEVQKLLEENSSGKRDAAFTILSVLCIEIWCQKFLRS